MENIMGSMKKSLLKKIATGVALVGLSAVSLGVSGCEEGAKGRLYFPAGKYQNINSLVYGQMEHARGAAPSNDSAFTGLPIAVYTR